MDVGRSWRRRWPSRWWRELEPSSCHRLGSKGCWTDNGVQCVKAGLLCNGPKNSPCSILRFRLNGGRLSVCLFLAANSQFLRFITTASLLQNCPCGCPCQVDFGWCNRWLSFRCLLSKSVHLGPEDGLHFFLEVALYVCSCSTLCFSDTRLKSLLK
jgi:hypothetical protein